MTRSAGIALSITALALAACGDDGGKDNPDADVDAPPQPVPVLKRPSKSSTIALTGNDARIVMVNPEKGTVTIFDAATDMPVIELPTGGEPSAVVIHPDDQTAFVANRADATVVKISGVGTAAPSVSGPPLAVGSEPTGLALSPTGKRLYVAEWAEGRIAVIDTATMTEVGAITAPKNPRGVAVTNDGDQDDDDELIIVPEFYGEPGAASAEATDTSRTGRVRIYKASDLSADTPITFAPIDSGFAPAGSAPGTPTVMTSPNQLWTAAIVGSKIYVPSVSASPAAPTNFQTNVQPVVYVGDLDARTEDRGAKGTVNLAALVQAQIPDTQTRFFLADIVDIDFVGTDFEYVLSRGADVVQRVDLSGAAPVLGNALAKQIDLNLQPAGSPGPCQNGTGLVIGHASAVAYVNCWGTRSLGVIDLSMMKLTKVVPSTTIDAGETDVQRGRHLFFTGRGRWSNNAWSSCGSCHPDGLSDNITWSFAAGPRQSTSLDGTYSHGAVMKERVLNWSGIFDELHDFERNTRGVQGGKGAITKPDPNIAGATCGNLAQEIQVPISADGLGRSAKLDQDLAGNCTHDWDKIDAWVQHIRPPRGLQKQDPGSVSRGAALFGEPTVGASNAGCDRCHGGPGWTASRRFFTPGATDPSALTTTAFTPPNVWAPNNATTGWNFHTTQINLQPASTLFDGAENNTRLGPNQVACVLRNVGTFGSDALEVRAGAVTRAQGRLGYNVPALYGLSLGAPYLHHGGAQTLAALFDDPTWQAHLVAGNPVWVAQGGTATEVAQKKADLEAFLLSIDPSTAEQDLPAGFDGCPPTQ